MDPTTTTQETRFEITVFAHHSPLQLLQMLVFGLAAFFSLVTYVVMRAEVPPWLIFVTEAVVLIGMLLFYRIAKPRLYAWHGFDLVRKELRKSYRSLQLTSFENNGRFVAVSTRAHETMYKVEGVITLVESDAGGFMLRYRIDLLPA